MDNPLPSSIAARPNIDTNHAKTLVWLAGLFVILQLLISALWPQQASLASDLTIGNILNAINKERQLRNLLTLNTNAMLSVAAQSKSDDMIARKYFSHLDPEGNYIWPKIEAAGYKPYLQLGENLAIEFYDTDSLVSAWMNSPTHRANVLNDGFKDQGMGLSFGDSGLGQYHSAVANTFGALLSKPHKEIVAAAQNPPAPAPVPAAPPAPAQKTQTPSKPAPVKTPVVAPAQQAPLPAPSKTETSAPTSAPAKATPLLAIRGDENLPSFTTPSKIIASTSPASSTFSGAALISQNHPGPAVTANQLSRYTTLAFGIILLLLLLSDLKISLDKKLQQIDKKANNLILLVLAIVVVALMYWL